MIKKTIGEILVDAGVLSLQVYHDSIKASEVAGVRLEEYLVQEHLVTDEDITRAYAHKFEVIYIPVITEKMADPELLVKVPLKFLRENALIPIHTELGDIVFVTSDPYNYQSLDELTLIFGQSVALACATRATIIDAINRYYPLEGTKEVIEELEEEQDLSGVVDFAAIDEEDILGMASEAPIIKLVNHMLYQAVKRGASDIHLEPFEKEFRVRYRVDGVMYAAMMPPKRAQAAITSRIKIMANLNIAEKRQPQDGRIQIKIADKAIDIRVSVLPVAFGERIVMRLLDRSRTFGSLKDLTLTERDFKVLSESISQPNGIMLVTGPTGSGKTTTLYSVLNELNNPDVNIVTVEDPVEYQMQGIGQVQVREKIGLTFAAALRSILRQDPDIVMIGETRDHETAQIAIQAALTGHFVLSTLHTNSAAGAITRLIDMGIEPFLIASTIVSVVAQRLVRKLCPYCKQIYKPEGTILRRLALSEHDTGVFYRANGCQECGETGYKGRLAIFEIMEMSHEVARLTMQRADTATIQEAARKQGMTLLVEDGIRKIREGLTTIEEVLTVATAREDLG